MSLMGSSCKYPSGSTGGDEAATLRRWDSTYTEKTPPTASSMRGAYLGSKAQTREKASTCIHSDEEEEEDDDDDDDDDANAGGAGEGDGDGESGRRQEDEEM